MRTIEELDVELVVAGMPLRVTEAVIEEGMSEVGSVTVIVASLIHIDFEPLLDEAATMTITSAGAGIRSFALGLGTARFKGIVDQTLRYELSLFPSFYFLGFRKNTRKFRDLPTEKIVDAVLNESGVTHEWKNTRPCDLRPYTVQYRESDFAFVSRLLEFEGIYFTFEDDGSMQLGDASSSEADVPGAFTLIETEAAHDQSGITSIFRAAEFGSGAAAVNDHNWKTPSTSLLAATASENDAAFEVYEYPVGYRTPAQGTVLAKLRMEAFTAEKRFVEGTSTVVEFRAGRGFDFTHEEAISFSGRYILVSVRHDIKTRWSTEAKGSYANSFKAIPADTPFRPKLATPHPVIIGNHTAMVRGPEGEEIHTDVFGRAKVQFHWDREAKGTDEDSRWIRTLQEASSSIVVSRVGWEVNVGYIDGDPDRPIGLARHINGQMVPTYGQPSKKNRMTLKTETYPGKEGFNELRMDDSAGSMFMDWHSQRDTMITVGNDKTEKIVNNQTHLIQHGLVRTVEKDQSLQVGTNETKQVGENYKERVVQDRNETIGGSETVSVARMATVNVQGNDTETVGSVRTTFVGSISVKTPPPKELMESLVQSSTKGFAEELGKQMPQAAKSAGDYVSGLASKSFPAAGTAAKAASAVAGGPIDIGKALENVIPTPKDLLSQATGGLSDKVAAGDLAGAFKGMIKRLDEENHIKAVGGAYTKLAGGQINYNVAQLAVEAVGGLKLTNSVEENITQTVAGEFVRAIGGTVFRTAKGTVSHSAQETDLKIGADMPLVSQEKVEFRGEEIELVATQSMKFESNGLKIELTPKTLTIGGKLKIQSKTSVRVTGNPDKLT